MDYEAKMYEIIQCITIINKLTSSITFKKIIAFEDTSICMPKFKPAELGFIRMVSWLYVHYYEVGKISVKFLIEKSQYFKLSNLDESTKHFKRTNNFRTYLQHNLDLKKERNLLIQTECEDWLKNKCDTCIPESEEDWKKCLDSMMNDAVIFFNMIKNCLQQIERDNNWNQISEEWVIRQNRCYPPHIFDEMINEVATDIGREYIDAVKTRIKFYSSWTKELENKIGKFDLKKEARKLIEHALITEMTPVLPITGRDLMDKFGLEPGTEIGRLLTEANKSYQSSPCTGEELLERIKAKNLIK